MSLLRETMGWVEQHSPEQAAYLQAVEGVCREIVPIINANDVYKEHNVLKRLIVPDQVIQFKVEWEDDNGRCRVNNGWRVQHNNLLGPYKGGTRFTPDVNTSVLKFLAFEQSFKNALSGLTLGAGKGGADFDPKHASESEIRRFCNAYMENLYRHIGSHTDVPAGDINVSDRELGWMYGKYLRLTKQYDGAISGKPLQISGSELRVEATGFGVIYFLQQVMHYHGESIEGANIAISGAGNVALHAALKANRLGAKVKTLSNSKGTYFDDSGLSESDLTWLIEHKHAYTNALDELAKSTGGVFYQKQVPWDIDVDIAIPCATQNEIDESCASTIVKRSVKYLVEGANMPCDKAATAILQNSDMIVVPGKASNAGGVILSGFEMQQNANFSYRNADQLTQQLQDSMSSIHEACVIESQRAGEQTINYGRSATVAGFRRLADAMVATGY